jgi:hypothetical protein
MGKNKKSTKNYVSVTAFPMLPPVRVHQRVRRKKTKNADGRKRGKRESRGGGSRTPFFVQ